MTPPRPRDPATPAEWQEAVDGAYGLLVLDSARQYGLITGGPTINAERAEEIIRRGAELGVTPDENAPLRVVAELSGDPYLRPPRKRASPRPPAPPARGRGGRGRKR